MKVWSHCGRSFKSPIMLVVRLRIHDLIVGLPGKYRLSRPYMNTHACCTSTQEAGQEEVEERPLTSSSATPNLNPMRTPSLKGGPEEVLKKDRREREIETY
ncbi:hypothetical protein CEXT_597221 [Caerostris extrusa]|uniref:Uncharacterized protein n=1 Tax=Caerostris extrusa TaxID=172846 RepID=A0AAV4Q7G3_CAEEX|nr:hypothetical protein CEXT_597221 [Caerostris extrusa]